MLYRTSTRLPAVLRRAGSTSTRSAATTTVDLRSDTVTRPCDGMRAAMHAAPLGDDVFRDDPTVQKLETEAAAMLGKEAALFAPSGTMTNLIGLAMQARRHGAGAAGTEVLLGDRSHVFLFEVAGLSALFGVGYRTLENLDDGTLGDPERVVRAAFRGEDVHEARTAVVTLEHTHNACGGRVLDMDYIDSVACLAHEHDAAFHLDGARIMNAAVKSGLSPARIAASADSVSMCLSKGLGAPVGSVLVGDRDLIEGGRRVRKMLGGGMRQAGVIASAGLFALRNNVERLAQDHAHARRLADGIAKIANEATGGRPAESAIGMDNPDAVDTNIVFFQVRHGRAAEVQQRLEAAGVRVGVFNQDLLRAVCHKHITPEAIDHTLHIVSQVNATMMMHTKARDAPEEAAVA